MSVGVNAQVSFELPAIELPKGFSIAERQGLTVFSLYDRDTGSPTTMSVVYLATGDRLIPVVFSQMDSVAEVIRRIKLTSWASPTLETA